MPRWLARLVAGESGVVLMTEIRGASNAKAKRDLGWKLRVPELARGFCRRLPGEPGLARVDGEPLVSSREDEVL